MIALDINALPSDRRADHGRQDVEKPEDQRASFRGVRGRDFEIEEIKSGEALDG
jgi:hypothetical protein